MVKKNELLYGFRVTEKHKSESPKGFLWKLQHEKTGAVVYWFQNGYKNKLFSVTFKTIPFDNTGVFHILEHCVHCGSEKYPVKNPFRAYSKRSMCTDVNAFTAPDYTMFHAASQNEKDFLNLVDILLDAVFHPLVLREEAIFMQEGCRIEFNRGKASYNGVVYNEINGIRDTDVFSLHCLIKNALFPDTCYRFRSGGDTLETVQLSYEDLISTYKKFYRPSNCVFYLDGDVPTDKVLPILALYLDAFDKTDDVHDIPAQTPVLPHSAEGTYAFGLAESTKNKTLLGFAKYLGPYDDQKRCFALSILGNLLFGTPGNSIKHALMQTGLVKDVFFHTEWNLNQPFGYLCIIGTEPEKKDRILNTVRSEAQRFISEGINKEYLTSVIDRLEIDFKHPNEYGGVARAKSLIRDHLYSKEPVKPFSPQTIIHELRSGIGTGYYESLVSELFLNGDYAVEAFINPDPGKAAAEAATEQENLTSVLATPGRLAAEQEKYRRYIQWQKTPDSDTALNTIPVLSAADLDPLPVKLNTVKKTDDGNTILFHKYKTNGIYYVSLYFNISDLSIEELTCLSFITDLFCRLPTGNYSKGELHQKIRRNFSCFDVCIIPITQKGATGKHSVYLKVQCNILDRDIGEACTLIPEILINTSFNSYELVNYYLKNSREKKFRNICLHGDHFCETRAARFSDSVSFLVEAVCGIEQYLWRKAFEEHFEDRIGDFAEFATNVMRRICASDRLTVSETANSFHPAFFSLYSVFPNQNNHFPKETAFHFPNIYRREAIVIPTNTCFTAFCSGLYKHKTNLTGEMRILSNILTNDYLEEEIRGRKGAYGCTCSINDKRILMSSWKDPNPSNTLRTFRSLPEYVVDFCSGDASLESHIIRSVSEGDPAMTPYKLGKRADKYALEGITYKDRCEMRKKMLTLEKDDLRKFEELLKRSLENGSACVIGSKSCLADLDGEWDIIDL